jgi:hypothetical protein
MYIGRDESDRVVVEFLLLNMNDEALVILRKYIESNDDLEDEDNDVYPGFSYEVHVRQFPERVSKLLKVLTETNQDNSDVVTLLNIFLDAFKDPNEPIIVNIAVFLYEIKDYVRNNKALQREIKSIKNSKKIFDSSFYKLISGFLRYKSSGVILDFSQELFLFTDKADVDLKNGLAIYQTMEEKKLVSDRLDAFRKKILYNFSGIEILLDDKESPTHRPKVNRFVGDLESIHERSENDQYFDLIFSISPRLSLKRNLFLPSEYRKLVSTSKFGSTENESKLIKDLIHLLNYDGVLLYLLPSIDLESEIDRIGRTHLIQHLLIRAVIDLPWNISKQSIIPMSILVLTSRSYRTHFLNLRESKMDPKLTDLFVKTVFDEKLYEDNALKKIISDWATDWRKEYTSSWGLIDKQILGKPPRFKKGLQLDELKAFSRLVITLSIDTMMNQGNKLSAEKIYYKHLNHIDNPILLDEVLDNNLEHAPVFRGITIKSEEDSHKEERKETDVYFVRLEEIDNFSIKFSNKFKIDLSKQKIDRYFLKEGDLLITARSSQFKTVVVPKIGQKLIVPSENLYVIRLDKSKVNPYFIKAFFDSELGKNQISSYRTTKATNFSVLSVSDLKKIQIPDVTKDEQDHIAEIFLDRQNRISNAKNALSVAEENYYLAFNKLFSNYGKDKS